MWDVVDRWLTKKTFFLSSFIGLALSYIFFNPVKFGICTQTYTLNGVLGCENKMFSEMSIVMLMFSVALLILLIGTYRLNAAALQAWSRFTFWWVPLSLITALASSDHTPSNVVGVSNQEFLTWTLLFLYIVFSLILISRKKSPF